MSSGDDQLLIPESELSWTATTSSGPGGQNVNKVATRVVLYFDLDGSSVLDEAQKERIREELSGRYDKQGRIRVSSQRHRSQSANLKAARERMAELIAAALEERKPRRATRPSRGAKRRRLREEKRRSEIKQGRGRVDPEG